MRQEFERHRFVNQLPVVDMLLFQSHSEFQVWGNDCFIGLLLPGIPSKEEEGGGDGEKEVADRFVDC